MCTSVELTESVLEDPVYFFVCTSFYLKLN